jgi:hypothetical protein
MSDAVHGTDAGRGTGAVGGSQLAVLPPDRDAALSMVVLRYPDPGTAKKMAAEMAPKTKKTVPPLQAGLLIRDDGNGRRHVADPTQGVAATARQSLVSWGRSASSSAPSPVRSTAAGSAERSRARWSPAWCGASSGYSLAGCSACGRAGPSPPAGSRAAAPSSPPAPR